MAAGGDGHWVLASMWSLLLVSFVFVVLRMYTRVYVIKSFGADDRMYNLAFVSQVSISSYISLTLSITVLSSHEYRSDDHWRTIWTGPESNGYLGRGARPLTTITTLRSCQPNVCDNSHEYRKMVFGSLSTTTRQREVAQDCHLVHDGLSHISFHRSLFCLLVPVYSTRVPLEPQDTRALPYRYSPCFLDTLQ